MNRPEYLDHMVNDTRSLVGDNLTFLPFGAHDLLPVLEYLHELEATLQRVRDLAARLEGGDHPLGKFIATDIQQALEGDPR